MDKAQVEALVGHKLVVVARSIPPVEVEHRLGSLEWGWCNPRLMAVRHVPGMLVVGRTDAGLANDRWVPVHLEDERAIVCVPESDGSWYFVVVEPDRVEVYHHPGPWTPVPKADDVVRL